MATRKRKPKAQIERERKREERLAKIEPRIKPLAKWHDIGVLDDDDSYQEAGEAYNSVTVMLEELDADRKEITHLIDEAKRRVMAKYEPSVSALTRVKAWLVQLITAYDDTYRAKQAVRIERQAKAAEKRGETALAISLRSTAITAEGAPPNAHVTLPGTWKGKVTSIKEMCGAIAAGDLPESLISVKDGELNRLARLYKEDLEKRFPGVKAELVKQVRRK